MANPARVPGKRGALPRDPDRYVPTLEHYLRAWEGPVALRLHWSHSTARALEVTGAGALPPAVGDVDRETEVSDWPMYVNGPDPSNPPEEPDGVGDCTIAERAHSFSAQRVYAGFPEPAFANSEIIKAYSACGGYVPGDPGTDNGCDPVTVLKYMESAGLPDTSGHVHRVAGFAAFGDPRNLTLMAQVLETFGTVALAIQCPQSAEDDFSSGQPWAYAPSSPDLGGHMICLQRRRTGGTGVLEIVTWGAIARVTRRFMWNQVTDAYAVVSQDWITANGTTVTGLDLEQLLSDVSDVE